MNKITATTIAIIENLTRKNLRTKARLFVSNLIKQENPQAGCFFQKAYESIQELQILDGQLSDGLLMVRTDWDRKLKEILFSTFSDEEAELVWSKL